MSDLTAFADYTRATISTASSESLFSDMIIATGNTFNSTGAWPLANLALYMPFLVGAPITIVKLFWNNGATVGSNNVDVGVYDSQGNQLVHSGSTATSGANVLQIVDITDTTLLPGVYYVAMSCNGTTDTFGRTNPTAPLARICGQYEQTSAFALSSTATFAASSRSYIPYIGMSLQVTI